MTTARTWNAARFRPARTIATRYAPRPRNLGTIAALGVLLLTGLVACGADHPSAGSAQELALSSVHTDAVPGADVNDGAPFLVRTDAIAAVTGTSEIPYPVYPNGRKYRVGGENGLKIVVFQTEDSFAEVDAYYKSVSTDGGLPRLVAMADYVRYPTSSDDADPWATHKPGIVIHEFDGQDARVAAGASASARTNIIMSY